ncbi:L-aspartate oxidase [Clostridium sp. WILCCON 0269]|uniref:L-aspartate oxidase n=1 Tax=Candidatus Clostridium eludens TaxID=3381663 RepID=A0ABW8SN72_9CLOT
MRRYLVDYNEDFVTDENFDVAIIGAGIAGLYTALMLPQDLKIVILSKRDMHDCDSYLAQGGIAASIRNDNRELHIKDTINAGCYVNNLDAVNVLISESQEAIDSLVKLGVNFDKDSEGNFYRSLEGNHSYPRILHVNGDSTGKGIMDTLIEHVENASNIKVITDIFAIDIVDNDKKYEGITAYYNNKFFYFKTKFCVVASGGIGQLFSKTTNADVLTGDGVAMALRAGVNLENMEYIQFHPTAFYSKTVKDKLFLISEAVRGEGAVLRNADKKRFMDEYDKRMELAPRDIVARAIKDQMDKTNSDYVYLDVTMYDKNFLKNRFNTIYSECRNNGIEMNKDYIPVTPAAHYFMGGIKVDLYGRTSVENFYAVGECACTGVHGANRLASNSLMEALVFGKRTAVDISNKIKQYEYLHCEDTNEINIKTKLNIESIEINFSALRENLKKLMEDNAGIIRSVGKLNSVLNYINDVLSKIENYNFDDIYSIEVYNMYQVSAAIITSILNSKTSIGSNYVEEYSKRSLVQQV